MVMKVKMRIGGFQKLSLLDYPKKLCATIWTVGCNFRCGYCHNANLVLPEKIQKLDEIPEHLIFSYLIKRRSFLDGVVITGGEPTLHNDLPDFLKKIKNLGYLVKLDTNGSNPSLLRVLIQDKLVDYIAMDVKAPIEMRSYTAVCGVNISNLVDVIDESITIISHSSIDYEFRTTLVPTLHSNDDIMEIVRRLEKTKLLIFQKFEPSFTLNTKFEVLPAPTDLEMNKITNLAQKIMKTVKWR